MKQESCDAALRRRAAGLSCVLAALPLLLIGCSKPEEAAAPVPEVAVVTLAKASVPLDLSYTARVRGEREVEVRARVSGILEKRFYKEGAQVAAGELLFRIDPQPFAAAARSAEGRLGMAKAQLAESEQQVTRIEQLNARGLASLRDRDLAQSAFASTKAAVAAASAELEAARLQLAWTEVRAPVAGVTGLETRSEGSLVNAQDDSSLLTTISQPQRLYVDFSMPESEARQVREALASNADVVKVRLQPNSGTALVDTASIDFLDARVDGDSGTVTVRATLSNEKNQLSPGQFVRASIIGLNSEAGVFVPARAVLYGADGAFVWKLDDKNLVQFAPVKLSPGQGNLLRADAGLAAGDRVIVDGVLKVAPQLAVKAVAADLQARPAGVASGK